MDSHFLVSSFTLLPSRLHSAPMLLLFRFGTQSMQISLPLTPLPTRRRYTRYIYKFIKFRSISNKRSTVSIDTFTSTERETMLKVLLFFFNLNIVVFLLSFSFFCLLFVCLSLSPFLLCARVGDSTHQRVYMLSEKILDFYHYNNRMTVQNIPHTHTHMLL